MKLLVWFIVFFGLVCNSCDSGRKFEFLNPDQDFTKSMMDGEMEEITLGCVSQLMYKQDGSTIVASYSSFDHEKFVYESWIFPISNNDLAAVDSVVLKLNPSAKVAGPFVKNYPDSEELDYYYTIENTKTGRIFEGSVSFYNESFEHTSQLKLLPGWHMFVDHSPPRK